MRASKRITLATLAALFIGSGAANAQQPSVPERVAVLKANVAASQAALRQYQWIETTVVSLKGEEKSNKQEQCYYGADGSLVKIPLTAAPAPEQKRGLRGRIVENKKEELTDYMQRAVALVKSYVPPSPAKIQAAKDAGKVSFAVTQPGHLHLNFRDYEKPGDNLGVEVDMASNRVLGLSVATYLDSASDAVTLNARMGQLPDGTSYAADIALDAKAKQLMVNVQNDGYRKVN
jgi:hypothetical protein